MADPHFVVGDPGALCCLGWALQLWDQWLQHAQSPTHHLDITPASEILELLRQSTSVTHTRKIEVQAPHEFVFAFVITSSKPSKTYSFLTIYDGVQVTRLQCMYKIIYIHTHIIHMMMSNNVWWTTAVLFKVRNMAWMHAYWVSNFIVVSPSLHKILIIFTSGCSANHRHYYHRHGSLPSVQSFSILTWVLSFPC